MNVLHYLYQALLLCLILFLPTRAQQPFQGPSGSPADMKKFHEEMAEFQKEFDALSPNEQESFFKSMDEAVKKIEDLSKTPEGKELLDKLEKGTISDKELDGLINQLVAEEKKEEKKKAPERAPEPKKPIVPKVVLTSKHEQIIDAINSLIAHTNAFIVKAVTIPELPGKFKQWAKANRIKSYPSATWNSLKADIEKLVSKLSMLLERNPQTKEYYHIESLLKNENLHNNIGKVQKNVSKYEPLFEELPLLEAKKMSKESKRAFHNIINEYFEALYDLHMIDEINKQLQNFDPIAKKYREEEVATRKKAEVSGKTSATPRRTFTGSSGLPSQGSTYTPLSHRPSYPGSFGPTATYGPPYQRAYPPPTPYAGSRSTPSKQIAKKTAPIKTKSEVAKKEESVEPEGVQIPLDKDNTTDLRLVESKIEDKLNSFIKELKESDLIKKIDTKLIDASPVDYTLAVETLSDLGKTLNMQKGILGDIHQYHRKSKNKTTRQREKKKLTTLFDKNKDKLDKLQKKINNAKQNWSALKKTVPLAKQYAFFGEKDASVFVQEEASEEKKVQLAKEKAQLAEAKNKIIAPYSLFEISNLLTTIREAINAFDQNTLPEIKK